MNVVLYGDSNTYGYNPNNERYVNRYGNVLKELLGSDYIVHEEGLVGRTTIYDDYRKNRKALDSAYLDLKKYERIDLLIIMLGTNDFKKNNAKDQVSLSIAMNKLINKIESFKITDKILLISPILLDENIENLDSEYDYNSYLLSKEASLIYKNISIQNDLLFFDAKEVAKPGIDGEHLTEEGHKALGEALAKLIKKI